MRDKFGRFIKGQPSENPKGLELGRGWNKGKKGWTNSGSFKKGHSVSNEWRKVISETHKGNTYRRGSRHTKKANEKNRLAHLGKVTMSGENHWNWKGGITPSRKKHYFSKEYKDWRQFVFERDDFTCQICGVKGGELRANHIKKYADYPKLRTIENNGITICQRCDIEMVLNDEENWESYFNFNLETRAF